MKPTSGSSIQRAAASRLRWLLTSTAVGVWVLACSGAGVELRPGTVLDFASLEEGRRILGERDAFIQAMSQFDRCVRMKTSRLVTEVEFLKYLTNQTRVWSASEQAKVSNLVVALRAPWAGLDLPLPPRIPLIKTSGSDEGGAAYCRGQCIVLPQSYLGYSAQRLRDILIHELFHIFSCHNRHLRPALYSVVGYFECGEVTLPERLQPLRITNPDAFHNSFAISLRGATRTVAGLPVIYSSSPTYAAGGELFGYLRFMLLEIEARDGRYVPVCGPDGEPQAVPDEDLADYAPQIGADSSMPIHPEEILAENFVLLVNQTPRLGSPRVVHLLRAVLLNPRSPWNRLPAGWYRGELEVADDARYYVEVSTSLPAWLACDVAQARHGKLEVVDREAWCSDARFYRARRMAPSSPAVGATNDMIWIAPGSFTMGSPPSEAGRSGWEGPLTPVTITRGFWLGEHEVTQGEHRLVLGTQSGDGSVADDLPVHPVSWSEATNYCARLTERVRSAGQLPDGYVYRLPTEAEWEYACRAGTTTPFSFGDDPGQVLIYTHAWFTDNSGNQARSVGLKSANPWGLRDVHGNVHEWCWDVWSERLPGRPVEDYAGPEQGTKRSYRGGSAEARSGDCRSAFRYGREPDQPWAGFRVALAPTLP